MDLGTLGPIDIEAALALSAAEGWSQTSSDWQRLIELEPDGCFAARVDGRVIGTVTTITYGRGLAWIGMMVVDAEQRGKGVGKALMHRSIAYARERGVETIKLDATPAGRPLYASLGFAAESEVERWQGQAAAVRTTPAKAPQSDALATLRALDRAAYGVDRSRLLARLLAESSAPAVVRDDAYALAREGKTVSTIGPLVAGAAAAAELALDAMLAQLEGRMVCVNRHVGGCLSASALEARGLVLRRSLTRMSLGTKSEAGLGPAVCGTAGPEVG